MEANRTLITSLLPILLNTPSPTGFTEKIVLLVEQILLEWGLVSRTTNRGSLVVTLPGKKKSYKKTLSAHLDTLGARVHLLKPNGRCSVMPIGTWSSRFAEGARVTIHSGTKENKNFRGTLLPLLASGHAYNLGVDNQPVNWEQIELRIDERVYSQKDLQNLGIDTGDYISIDPQTEINENGYIFSRHLDDKAGVVTLLVAIKKLLDTKKNNELPHPVDIVFTVREEVGDGGSAILDDTVKEFITVDNAVHSPNQNSSEFGVTFGMGDQTGPYDQKLIDHLVNICQTCDIQYQKDLFRFYRSDLAAALEAGNDTLIAHIGFGLDASHGYERTHLHALESIVKLVYQYFFSKQSKVIK